MNKLIITTILSILSLNALSQNADSASVDMATLNNMTKQETVNAINYDYATRTDVTNAINTNNVLINQELAALRALIANNNGGSSGGGIPNTSCKVDRINYSGFAMGQVMPQGTNMQVTSGRNITYVKCVSGVWI